MTELPKELVVGWSAYWNDFPQSTCPLEKQELWMIGWLDGKKVFDLMQKHIEEIRKQT